MAAPNPFQFTPDTGAVVRQRIAVLRRDLPHCTQAIDAVEQSLLKLEGGMDLITMMQTTQSRPELAQQFREVILYYQQISIREQAASSNIRQLFERVENSLKFNENNNN